MKTFFALLALWTGISPVTGVFPAQRPATRSFDIFFVRTWTDSWGNNGDAGDLKFYRAHYDAIIMFVPKLGRCFNSSRPSDAKLPGQTRPYLRHIMTYHLVAPRNRGAGKFEQKIVHCIQQNEYKNFVCKITFCFGLKVSMLIYSAQSSPANHNATTGEITWI